MSYGADERCEEIRKFIENAGIRLIVRDLKKDPLSPLELEHLFGYNPMRDFLNPLSKEYTNLGLDKQLPERRELLQMIADHPELLRRPIIKTSRLVTVGCDRKAISAMLQIPLNGTPPNGGIVMEDTPPPRRNNRRSVSAGGR
jgi:arsenate reductase-like glutaredoxin family protein